MKVKTLLLALLAPLLIVCASAARQEPVGPQMVISSRADLAQAMSQIQADLLALDSRFQAYRGTAEKLVGLYSDLSKRVEAVVKAAEAVKPGSADAAAWSNLQTAIKQIREGQMSFNLQYLQLQNSMQNESRQFTMISNIMKTKHDAVKNSISNIR